MLADPSDRMKIAVYYAAWAVVCASAAGVLMALIHTWFFSYVPNRAGLMDTLFADLVAALAIAAGQGAVALLTGSVLARLGRVLQRTVLLGLLVGLFDFALYLVQTAVPATELGWLADIAVLVVATVVITLSGGAPATTV